MLVVDNEGAIFDDRRKENRRKGPRRKEQAKINVEEQISRGRFVERRGEDRRKGDRRTQI